METLDELKRLKEHVPTTVFLPMVEEVPTLTWGIVLSWRVNALALRAVATQLSTPRQEDILVDNRKGV